MPKLKVRPPKYCRQSKSSKYAIVYWGGKTIHLGLYNSRESRIKYSQIIAEILKNPDLSQPTGDKNFIICELSAAFLEYAKANFDPTEYAHFRVVILEFLDKLYGDDTLVDSFKPRCLKRVREMMIRSGRFCRRVVNRYTFRIVSIFAWGVENDLVSETTWSALKVVKSLPKGYPGTFDNEERQPVSDDVIRRTLPFMPPTLQAMVIVQRLTGMRPNEIYKMRVGDIDRTQENGLWYYVPNSYKTSRYVGKIKFPLGKPEQKLISPYLEGKKPEQAVFSLRTAIQERNAEKRANRKTKISPSQAARDKARAAKPSRYAEFYTQYSYRQAIEYAILKGNRQLKDGEEKIPHWFPYQLRHTAATATELEFGDTDAQALLGHKSLSMTKMYSKAQFKQREELARKRRNPFEKVDEESDT